VVGPARDDFRLRQELIPRQSIGDLQRGVESVALPETYDPVLRVDDEQSIRRKLPATIRAVGVGAILAFIATAIFMTLHSI
jgi:hypothetical protein